MLFSSLEFLFLFLPVALGGTLVLRGVSRRLGFIWLVACSLFYYGYWSPEFLALILGSIGLNYGVAQRLRGAPGKRPRTLTLGVVGNLVVLGYFKYFGFFIESLAVLTGGTSPFVEIVLPIGVSFFTFQQIALLIDAHRGKIDRLTLVDHALFVSFFPQLIAGPIVHHSEMMSQFHSPPSRERLRKGLAIGAVLFSIGLFKKVVIADWFALNATAVFSFADGGGTPNSFDAWVGALSYTLQIYFDFSGYSDMAIGLGLAFGIRLPLNFDSPYQSTSIVEFWRRWHITLSRFLRDYLYIPLGGNRRGPVRRYINLFATMLLGGLWHGAGWTFVAWGALHGLYLSINHAARRLVQGVRPGLTTHYLYRLMAFGATTLAVVVAWVFFRAETFAGAWQILESMFALKGLTLPEATREIALVADLASAWSIEFSATVASDALSIAAIPLFFILTWSIPNACVAALKLYDGPPQEPLHASSPHLRPLHLAWAAGLGIALALHSIASPSEFIYFQF